MTCREIDASRSPVRRECHSNGMRRLGGAFRALDLVSRNDMTDHLTMGRPAIFLRA